MIPKTNLFTCREPWRKHLNGEDTRDHNGFRLRGLTSGGEEQLLAKIRDEYIDKGVCYSHHDFLEIV
jgi:hypothetical protein